MVGSRHLNAIHCFLFCTVVAAPFWSWATWESSTPQAGVIRDSPGDEAASIRCFNSEIGQDSFRFSPLKLQATVLNADVLEFYRLSTLREVYVGPNVGPSLCALTPCSIHVELQI